MFKTTTLDNGIRIVHKSSNSKLSYLGLIINAGSRDENEYQHGLAHFIEHLLFKGTKKRRAFHVLSRIEDIGGEIDAYTTKEDTCITACFLTKYYERTIELFNDIFFNSTFPIKEIEKERNIIIDEINSYKDTPAENIFDEFEDILFAKHSLGRNILGTSKSIKKFTNDDINNFINTNYNTDQLIISSIGNIKFENLVELCKKYFGLQKANYRTFNRIPFNNFSTQKIIKKPHTHQTHCILGNYAYPFLDKNRLTLFTISNILAGPALNSRLVLQLREKKALSYNIEANYVPYEDIGIFNIYFSTDKENINKVLDIIYKEIELLKTKKLGVLQLSKIKKQLIGQTVINNEQPYNVLMSAAKAIIMTNKIEGINKFYNEIEKLNSSQIIEVANEILDIDKFSQLTYI